MQSTLGAQSCAISSAVSRECTDTCSAQCVRTDTCRLTWATYKDTCRLTWTEQLPVVARICRLTSTHCPAQTCSVLHVHVAISACMHLLIMEKVKSIMFGVLNCFFFINTRPRADHLCLHRRKICYQAGLQSYRLWELVVVSWCHRVRTYRQLVCDDATAQTK